MTPGARTASPDSGPESWGFVRTYFGEFLKAVCGCPAPLLLGFARVYVSSEDRDFTRDELRSLVEVSGAGFHAQPVKLSPGGPLRGYRS